MKNCYILIGPPGSGKTAFVNSLKGTLTRISQDNDGKEHYMIFLSAIINGASNIIVDRMNFDIMQRCRYALPAAYLKYRIIYVIFPGTRQLCLERCFARKDHQTIKNQKSANNAINNFFDNFEPPDKLEPYYEVIDSQSKKAIIFYNDLKEFYNEK